MKKITFLLSLLISIYSFAQDLIITEIMKNPSAVGDDFGEYFEIYNNSSNSIDIDGWTIRDDDTNSHTIDNGGALIVEAGSFFVLSRNSDFSTNGGINVDYEYTGIDLANGADEVILENLNNEIIDQVFYDGGTNFPSPNGASMELSVLTDDNNVGSNWQVATMLIESSTDFGTPGMENTNSTLSNPQLELLKSTVAIFPNPSINGKVTFASDLNEEVEVSIFNSFGAVVRKTVVEGSQTISTENLARGIYFVQLNTASGSVAKRLIVQ